MWTSLGLLHKINTIFTIQFANCFTGNKTTVVKLVFTASHKMATFQAWVNSQVSRDHFTVNMFYNNIPQHHDKHMYTYRKLRKSHE